MQYTDDDKTALIIELTKFYRYYGDNVLNMTIAGVVGHLKNELPSDRIPRGVDKILFAAQHA